MARSLHPFPARMAPEIAIKVLPSNGALRVMDPMCGSGTVLAEAAARGHQAIGLDIDPLAVLMSRVATRPLDVEAFKHGGLAIVARATASSSGAMPWGRSDRETHAFSRYWFGERQRTQLAKLSHAIGEVTESAVREALQISLSRVIVTKAPKASLAADTAHSRPHRTLTKSDYDVFAGFMGSVREVARILARRSLSGTATVDIGDSRNLHSVQNGSIDWTITSPPYLNAIDYMRGHKMSLIWLGYSIEELRKIRSSSIGAERSPTGDMTAGIDEMVETIKRSAIDPDGLPLGILKRYAADLLRFSGEIGRTTRSGGHVVLVVGNSTLRGNYIENDRLARLAIEGSGFKLLDKRSRKIPETRRYLPTSVSTGNSALGNRMRSESVMIFRKPA